MELIVLNIGYDLGIISAEIFTMLVIMAIVTTFMTGPSLSLVNYLFKKKETIRQSDPDGYKILISFANCSSKLFLPSKNRNMFAILNFSAMSN